MILADTHVILWLAFTPAKLSHAASLAIDRARRHGERVAISGISLLEIALLRLKGRVHLNASLENFLAGVESRFTVMPITSQVCPRTVEFPSSYPKDPDDRIIGATALVNGVALVTADRAIQRSTTVPTVW